MTKALALDLAPHKITVNCVVPGTIETAARPARRARAARAPARAAADRPARRAGGDRRDGAHALRPRRALHHRPVDPRQRRRVHAVKQAAVSPVMQQLERLHRAGARSKPLPPAVRREDQAPRPRHDRGDGLGLAPAAGPQRHFVRQERSAARRRRASSAAASSRPPINAALANGMLRARRRDRRLARAFADASRAAASCRPRSPMAERERRERRGAAARGRARLRRRRAADDVARRLPVPRGRPLDAQLRPDVRRRRRGGRACSA